MRRLCAIVVLVALAAAGWAEAPAYELWAVSTSQSVDLGAELSVNWAGPWRGTAYLQYTSKTTDYSPTGYLNALVVEKTAAITAEVLPLRFDLQLVSSLALWLGLGGRLINESLDESGFFSQVITAPDPTTYTVRNSARDTMLLPQVALGFSVQASSAFLARVSLAAAPVYWYWYSQTLTISPIIPGEGRQDSAGTASPWLRLAGRIVVLGAVSVSGTFEMQRFALNQLVPNAGLTGYNTSPTQFETRVLDLLGGVEIRLQGLRGTVEAGLRKTAAINLDSGVEVWRDSWLFGLRFGNS